jgi:hypothetical protein
MIKTFENFKDDIVDNLGGDANISDFEAFLASLDEKEVGDIHSRLTAWKSGRPVRAIDVFRQKIGNEVVKYIEDSNRVSFERRYAAYGEDQFEMEFIETDNKGDDVIFFHIIYDMPNDKWSLGSSVSHDEEFDTYDELCQFYRTLEDKLYDNGDHPATIMFKDKNGKICYFG